MELFKGKSPSERNKIIAAIVLGALAIAALLFAFGPGLFSKSSTTTASAASPTPKASPSPSVAPGQFQMPTAADQQFDYVTTPVVYNPGMYGTPDPGRNIFAFYEPPPPTPWSPTPFVAPSVKPPTPTPTPPYLVGFVQPQSVYAGSRGFRLEVNGNMFTPDSKIYFSQALLPTTFVNQFKLTADVPANFITGEGPRQIIVQSLDGTKYSNQVMLSVQPPPKPQLVYVGVMLKKPAHNDTAYFIEQTRMNTAGAAFQANRLNDIIEGRFRLLSISTKEVIVEDVNLGFRHRMPLYQPTPGSMPSGGPPTSFPQSGFPQGMPTTVRPGSIPGFPSTMPAPRPANANRPVDREKKGEDEDDNDPK